MATVEVDEEQVRRSAALQKTIGDMLKNPRAKLLLEQAHKEIDPNAPTPELDNVKMMHEAQTATRDEIKALKKQLEDDKAAREQAQKLDALNQKVEKGFAKLRAAGVTDKGIESVKKIMDEEGILTPEVAWAYFEKNNPPQAPITQSTGGWDFLDMPKEGSDDLKRLLETKGENDRIVDKIAFDTLNEIRRR